jgi:chorismate synthase
MTSDDSPVGYKRPPVHSRFQKGQSGNPGGRPKKEADFMEDAVEIIGGTVTGQAKGKPITLPMVQAMFRRLCREALKGDNPALGGSSI